MKKKFLIRMFSFFVAFSLIKSSIVLAQEQTKNLEQKEKKFSPEQEKEKEQNVKTIKEALNKVKSLEEQMQKKINNMFKNFKKEDYEVKNYDLEVFKKNNTPILIYTHKKTGAKVYFNLCLDKDKLKQMGDSLIFKAPTKDDKGLIHFLEHCLNSYIKYFTEKLQISGNDINAITYNKNLEFVSRVGVFGLNENLEKEYVEKLATEFNNPSFLKKGNKNFDIEKSRVLIEIKDKKGENLKTNEEFELFNLREYTPGGKISEVEKVKIKDLKNCYEKYIHPSNCLLIKNVLELNPKKIKNYLNLWHEKYFGRYDKKGIKDNKYELRNKEKYIFKSLSKDSQQFVFFDKKNNKKQSFKYKAMLENDLTKFNLKQTLGLKLVLEPFKEEIEKFFKNLGYKRVKFGREIQLFGNKKELFSQKVLEENYKKIMNFIENKLKNLNEEDLFYLNYYNLKNFNKFEINNLNLKSPWVLNAPDNYFDSDLDFKIIDCFIETGKLIDEKFFLINKNNELENENEIIDKYVKENIDIYGKLAQIGPKHISVFEQNDKTIKQTYKKEYEKYKLKNRVLPVKLKEKNLKNEFVEDFAKILLNKALTNELEDKLGLTYKDFRFTRGIENNFAGMFEINKDSVKRLEDYIFKNFDEIMKNIKLKEKDLDELKKQYKEDFKFSKKQYDDYFKNEGKIIKDFKNYIKTGKIDQDSVLQKKDLKIKDCLKFFPSNLIEKFKGILLTFDVDFKDREEFFEKQTSFKEKYVKMANKKVTPEFIKDFLENLIIPTFKKLKKAYKLSEKKLKALDSVKFSEVKDLIKTVYLVKDKEEIEKVNKNIMQKLLRIEKLKEEIDKSF